MLYVGQVKVNRETYRIQRKRREQMQSTVRTHVDKEKAENHEGQTKIIDLDEAAV